MAMRISGRSYASSCAIARAYVLGSELCHLCSCSQASGGLRALPREFAPSRTLRAL